MEELDKHELDCLRKVASVYSNVISPCAHDILHRLESLGLIEQAPNIYLPLELLHTSYRLTHAGKAVLMKKGSE